MANRQVVIQGVVYPVDEELEVLLERAKKIKMTPEDMRAQRRSFAYGNVHMSNPSVTWEDVDKAIEELDKEELDNGRQTES